MESVNYPPGWFEQEDSDHHPLCPVNQPEGEGPCRCNELEYQDRVQAAEFRRDMERGK